jgi:hypothetical protein
MSSSWCAARAGRGVSPRASRSRSRDTENVRQHRPQEHPPPTHPLVYSLDVLHHLGQPGDEMSRVDLGEGHVVLTQILRLRDQLLPARVTRKKGPLFPPETEQLSNSIQTRSTNNHFCFCSLCLSWRLFANLSKFFE